MPSGPPLPGNSGGFRRPTGPIATGGSTTQLGYNEPARAPAGRLAERGLVDSLAGRSPDRARSINGT
ncbi:unnamed protein product [Gadus morhua 'NCC']